MYVTVLGAVPVALIARQSGDVLFDTLRAAQAKSLRSSNTHPNPPNP